MSASVVSDRTIHRILVALDPSSDSRAALRAAVELAEILDAELLGLYVEDQELIHLPRLPSAREIDSVSGERRRLRRGELERQLRVEAERLRHALERHARAVQVRWTFRSTRGRVAREVLDAASEADLVILGATGRSPLAGPGSTARAVVAEAGRPVMVLRSGARLGAYVHVVYDGTPAAVEALEVASRLARGRETLLTVVLVDEEGEESRRGEVVEWLLDREMEARIVPVPPGGRAPLASFLHGEGSGPVVVPRSAFESEPRLLRSIVRGVERPLVVVG